MRKNRKLLKRILIIFFVILPMGSCFVRFLTYPMKSADRRANYRDFIDYKCDSCNYKFGYMVDNTEEEEEEEEVSKCPKCKRSNSIKKIGEHSSNVSMRKK